MSQPETLPAETTPWHPLPFEEDADVASQAPTRRLLDSRVILTMLQSALHLMSKLSVAAG